MALFLWSDTMILNSQKRSFFRFSGSEPRLKELSLEEVKPLKRKSVMPLPSFAEISISCKMASRLASIPHQPQMVYNSEQRERPRPIQYRPPFIRSPRQSRGDYTASEFINTRSSKIYIRSPRRSQGYYTAYEFILLKKRLRKILSGALNY